MDLVKLRMQGYITAQNFVMVIYNVANDILHQAIAITPGKRSPTVTNLDDGISKSVSALVHTKEANQVLDKLHEVGATDILVMKLHNTRM